MDTTLLSLNTHFLGASWVPGPVLGAEDMEVGSRDEGLLSLSPLSWVIKLHCTEDLARVAESPDNAEGTSDSLGDS